MRSLHLIGGGRDPEGVRACHAPFVAAAGGGPIACLAVDDGEGIDTARWEGQLTATGAADVRVVVLDGTRAPGPGDVAGAAAVYVCGGLTPRYRDVLAGGGTGWLPADVPVAGYSAGAAIAPRRALVGGWRLHGRPVCPPDAAEDLDELAVAPGLGLLDAAVDVHAATWGTLGRLVAAVAEGLVPAGFAVDEHTALILDPGAPPRVAGAGRVHHVVPDDPGGVRVRALVPG